jgi:hypothetical protein
MYCENYEPMPFILAYKQEKSNKIHMISRIGAVRSLEENLGRAKLEHKDLLQN